MKTIKLGNSGLVSSRLLYGCMRIIGDNTAADREKGKEAIRAALEEYRTNKHHIAGAPKVSNSH